MQNIVLSDFQKGKTIENTVEKLGCPFCRELLFTDVEEFRPLYDMFTGAAKSAALVADLQETSIRFAQRINFLRRELERARERIDVVVGERDLALDQVSDRELERSGWHSDDGADPDYVPGPGRRQRRRLNANVRQI